MFVAAYPRMSTVETPPFAVPTTASPLVGYVIVLLLASATET